eukprot:TRINITY_DN27030_c0_g1_i1.p1 TRINITY_DN27030_c0_g1~~TRINITY_DN27030_c0_g1_i1.p1  ORF type:complete len:1533 (+),score=247.93 TRINITY_DN27030_c0_g1_i1:55-4653(+)
MRCVELSVHIFVSLVSVAGSEYQACTASQGEASPCLDDDADDFAAAADSLADETDLMDVRLLQTSIGLTNPRRAHTEKRTQLSLRILQHREGRHGLWRKSVVQEVVGIQSEWMVVAVYISMYVASVLLIVHGMTVGPSDPESKVAAASQVDLDAETRVWRQGVLGWLAVSWASPWVARWGHSLNAALTKISAEELPQLGFRVDQANSSADEFERAWAEEALKGEKASVRNAILKMWPKYKLWIAAGAFVGQILVGQLYSIFLVRFSLMKMYQMQAWISEHPFEERHMTEQMLVAIIAFTIYPVGNIFVASLANSICVQLDQRMCGGLAVALFRKGQRLPSTSSAPNQTSSEGAKVDLQTLLNHDIFDCLQGSFENFCMCISGAFSVMFLLVLMAMQLRLATLFALGIVVPCVIIGVVFGAAIGNTMVGLQQATDMRVRYLREVLLGIRVVKCYGWELAMQKRLAELRGAEVTSLKYYWTWTGVLTNVIMVFPRLLIFGGLWGYTVIYGVHDVATIFTSLQILACLRGSCEIFISSLARIAAVSPSILRIQTFLQMPEAPRHQFGGQTPEWLRFWPESAKDAALEIQGTFRWGSQAESPVAVQDIQMSIPRGELVAIVGAVGSGKSALIQAILGELPPDTDTGLAKISRPEVVAYCPQVAHIAEGTLKDNVLFGQTLDKTRYEESLEAASLREDLKVLPGGDQVPIGARGISLSGGQKARVSMARAAYHFSSPLVILDDPFGSVDAPTAKTILNRLLLGSLMKDRTCIVATQPDAERILKFDRVVLMDAGKIVQQGKPEDVMAAEAYKKLLSSKEGESFEEKAIERQVSGDSPQAAKTGRQQQPEAQLRDDEFEGRPSLNLIWTWALVGRLRNILAAALLMCLSIYLFLFCDLTLAHWTNELTWNPQTNAMPYLRAYLFWIVMAMIAFYVAYDAGMRFTMRISGNIHHKAVHSLLRAPIDRFFDKQPVGRIMSRLAGDLTSVDLALYARSLQTVVVIYAAIMPVLYVHTIMPLAVTAMALPLYYVIYNIYARYRNTSIPMRYCFASTKSDMNGLVTDIMASNAVGRAYCDQGRLSDEMCLKVDRTLKVSIMTRNVLKRWLNNRVQYLWSFLTSTTYVIALLHPEKIGAGTLGVCMTNLLLMQTLIEANIDTAIGSLFELIALARINEYVEVPQERSLTNKSDAACKNFTVRLARAALPELTCVESANGTQVRLGSKLLLQSTKDCRSLEVTQDAELRELCMGNLQLRDAHSWHRIAGVNDLVGNATLMAQEICGRSSELVLDLRSGWIADGAKVELENVRAGYADIPRDVLRNINLCFEQKTKVGVVGTTGCGKSSLLLVLLRILEPRGGRVLINGIDTATLGLATLRGSLGLVPQDPILFSGTIRHNLDPLGCYTDGRIWEAVRCANLEGLVRGLPGELEYQVCDEGSNLSFGQRQLFCLARMILRQPALLLLDEATSAIDPRTQEIVQQTITTAFPDSTLVAIAHRLETILDFDHVVVLDQGTVAEEGKVADLAQREGGRLHKMLAARKLW